MRDKELCDFMKAREQVRLNKERGLPRAQWTKDAILATYRFCNVHREDDAVSKWMAANWRAPNAGLDDLWFAMVIARLFNLPRTLEFMGFPLPWQPERMRQGLHQFRDRGLPIFNGAYIVSTNGVSMDKVDYLFARVLGPLWAARKQLRPRPGTTLEEWHTNLMRYDGLGSFMAAQVVADMKYVEPLLSAPDWQTFAASGPGSRRGLNRVMGFGVDSPWPGRSWNHRLEELHQAVHKRLPGLELHAQDLQNCLCEFDKYERVRLGEGRPKQLYKEA